ncbi:MAG: hypothetical protein RLZZ232_1640, partial [Planctomycetota bacterium]
MPCVVGLPEPGNSAGEFVVFQANHVELHCPEVHAQHAVFQWSSEACQEFDCFHGGKATNRAADSPKDRKPALPSGRHV